MTATAKLIETDGPTQAPAEEPAGLLPLRLLRGGALRGANVYHGSMVFRQRVELGACAGLRTGEAGPRFARRFVERFVGLEKSTANGHMTDEFLTRLNGEVGVPFEAALFEAILAVELSMALRMRRLGTLEYAEIVDTELRRTVDFVWQSQLPAMSRAAAGAGLAGVAELLPERLQALVSAPGWSFAAWLSVLEKRAARLQWSTAAADLARAARARGLPCEPLGDAYLLLGQGVAQQVIYASAAGGDAERRPADAAVLDQKFPPGTGATIPIAVIAGRRGTGLTARELEGILRATGRTVGLATRKDTKISGEPVERGSIGRRDGALLLLHDPRVDVLVAAASPRRIVRRGLRLDECTALALVDPDAKFDTDESRLAFEVVAGAASGAVIAGIGSAAAMAALRAFEPQRVVLVAGAPHTAAVRRHLAEGGCVVQRVAGAGGDRVELCRGRVVVSSLPIPAAHPGGRQDRERSIRARMFAAALAHALGVSGRDLATAVKRRMVLHR